MLVSRCPQRKYFLEHERRAVNIFLANKCFTQNEITTSATRNDAERGSFLDHAHQFEPYLLSFVIRRAKQREFALACCALRNRGVVFEVLVVNWVSTFWRRYSQRCSLGRNDIRATRTTVHGRTSAAEFKLVLIPNASVHSSNNGSIRKIARGFLAR